MERVGVVGYDKDRSTLIGIVRVTLTLRTADPARRRQPVAAQGETEAAAVLLALEYAEGMGTKTLSVPTMRIDGTSWSHG